MKKIIHVDADCFFASVELKQKPELNHLPVAVGGSPSGRGVITTCNYVARACGVKSAMSSAHALRICPDLHFFTPNMPLYKKASSDIFEILGEYTEKLEVVSIDEAYLDVSNTSSFSGSATLIARDIQARVRAELGLNISAGVAPSKLLAKIASDWRKPVGIFTVAPTQVDDFVSQLKLKLLPGVGPKTVQKLNSLGLYFCQDIRDADPCVLHQHFGVFAKRLIEMSFGIDEREVKTERRSKSLSIEQTFDVDIDSYDDLIPRLPGLLSRLADRYDRVSSVLSPQKRTLKLKFADFTHTSIEAGLSSFGDVLDLAQYQRLAYLARKRHMKPVRLLGLGLRFAPAETSKQLELPLICSKSDQ